MNKFEMYDPAPETAPETPDYESTTRHRMKAAMS